LHKMSGWGDGLKVSGLQTARHDAAVASSGIAR
jgi:hypothetical protein